MADLYKVLSQRQTSVLDSTGRISRGVSITIETKSGTLLEVPIPEVDYMVGRVRDLLEAAAQTAEEIAAL